MLAAAREIHDLLPPEEVGTCVLTTGGDLSRSSPQQLRGALERREVRFHAGRLRGALPQPGR
jgi:hypothetical protein